MNEEPIYALLHKTIHVANGTLFGIGDCHDKNATKNAKTYFIVGVSSVGVNTPLPISSANGEIKTVRDAFKNSVEWCDDDVVSLHTVNKSSVQILTSLSTINNLKLNVKTLSQSFNMCL